SGLLQPDAWASMIQELDAGFLKNGHHRAHFVQSASQPRSASLLHGAYGVDVDPGTLRKRSLVHVSQGARGAKLVSGCEHSVFLSYLTSNFSYFAVDGKLIPIHGELVNITS
ncbi:hypothetical protein, partial [Mesorhizobium sp. B2-6-7]|uniref:hypothetical protein n=1 Tax=Mesorhizobium sp. B2-6-7 TaxID=2589910 RepID=UPI001AEEBBA3